MTSPNDKTVEIKRPNQLEKMLDLARKLSANMIFVRVDFYSINDEIYFGEFTFHPGGGNINFVPQKYDKIVGDMLQLPLKNK